MRLAPAGKEIRHHSLVFQGGEGGDLQVLAATDTFLR
uniref:Uncharacterized protein n=1 Tax=Magnetospirillum gryphiswaldense TaxID=55518 RepID=A4TYW3_9PROT|nr:hypothetical protein MGR_0436 [Magnetospirillum gryphiswaldense MSR-1]